ncbi:LysE family translocator [Pseudomonas panipatensis]|jgi:chemosensory pili system protein ChpE|uniref:Chemosensory pili system protein ChpE n=1 Tax=Pseudomonas panipatensis TaxID=428992 RepID=A0A1G8J808_9PSED|nr:LysE family translocator [Pseudomonas panipatensis]SDI27384.1 chemosensory pili system protein ChpE [Pseudomonas panipatensis]SMP49928.1 chemosensory pili system protein ChpE [Pseudomonas panipatensis]
MLAIFFAALLFGFAFNVSPGAVFSETLRRGLTGGFRPALLVQLGSLIGDALWALIGLTGLALLLAHEQVRLPLTLACAAYLAWLGVQGLRDAWRPPLDDIAAATSAGNAFASGAVISLSNPKNLVYWGALGSALAGIVEGVPSQSQSLVFFAGFMLSSLIWCFLCAALVDWLRRNTSLFWHRVSYAGCGLLLLGLAGVALRGI